MSHLVRQGAPPLGIRTKRVKLVDYYTVPWDDVPAGTPSPVMIAVVDWATGNEEVFAWHLVAEWEGIPDDQIPARQVDLERRVLQEFGGHVAANPKARWV